MTKSDLCVGLILEVLMADSSWRSARVTAIRARSSKTWPHGHVKVHVLGPGGAYDEIGLHELSKYLREPAEAGSSGNQEITEMRGKALKLATELRDRASDIERAANILAAIARDDNRTESIDGPEWDKAARTLESAGIEVTLSSHYMWG